MHRLIGSEQRFRRPAEVLPRPPRHPAEAFGLLRVQNAACEQVAKVLMHVIIDVIYDGAKMWRWSELETIYLRLDCCVVESPEDTANVLDLQGWFSLVWTIGRPSGQSLISFRG